MNIRPTAAISDYLSYFDKTWIFGSSYPPSMWNISSAADYDEPCTNNASEDCNNSLASTFSSSHPDIWTFIDSLKNFHAEVELKYCQISNGRAPNEPQRKRWRDREAEIRRHMATYNPNQKLIFMRRIGLKFS